MAHVSCMQPRSSIVGPLIVGLLVTSAATAGAQEPPPPGVYEQQPPPPDQPYPETNYPAPSEVPGSWQQGYSDTDPRALSDFRSTLDPYGRWLDDPNYGTVWIPYASSNDPSFQPYVTAGRWTYDGSAWTWVSDYPWGWAAFHYGRWVWIPGAGWAWVPGRAYSGAWVDWRVGNGYLGWRPLPPHWAWRHGVAESAHVATAPAYYFSRHDQIFSPGIGRYVVRGAPYVNRTVPYAQVAPPANRERQFAGPPPTMLGIPSTRVAAPPAGDVGLARARTYASPAPAGQPNRPPPQAPSPAPARPGPRQSPQNQPPTSAPPATRVR
jgi:hypothetical protein